MAGTLLALVFVLAAADSCHAQELKDKQQVSQQTEKAPRPFELGIVEVTVVADSNSPLSAAETILTHWQDHNRQDVGEAADLATGVTIFRSGPRNEAGVYIRGFDARQIPVFVDGIPVYVPYEGYLDLSRLTTLDLSQVRIAKGFSSVLYGPNSLGGAVNLVSRKPRQPREGSLGTGVASGGEVFGYLDLGALFNSWFVEGGASWLQSNGFPLSGDFRPTGLQGRAARENADRRDAQVNLKAGYTPNGADEYAIRVVSLRARKGNPPYAGGDASVRPRFWRWPQWDKDSVYFLSSTALGRFSYLKTRGYYDTFRNTLDSFDDSSYSAQTRPSSFRTFYDDYSLGGSVELGRQLTHRHQLAGVFHGKYDVHREHNRGEAVRTFRDQVLSIALEHRFRLNGRTEIISGLGVDHLRNLQAQDYQNGELRAFPASSLTALNPQIGFFRRTDAGTVHISISRKSRLPTLKDRYSYRLGLAIPNASLQEESAVHWEVGYSGRIDKSTDLQLSVFYSPVRNLVRPFYLSPDLYQLRNIGKTEHAGGEVAITRRLGATLDATLQYGYLNRKNISQPSVVLTEAPRHKSFATVAWRPMARLEIRGNLSHESGRYNLNQAGHVYRMPSFGLLGTLCTVKLNESTQVEIGGENLLDKNYAFFEGYPEPGRTGFVNLRYRFQR